MTDPTASVEDELDRALQVSLAVAAHNADRLARARLERIRDAQHAAEVDARRLEARLRVEGGSAVARLAVVDRAEWWDRASSAEVATMWELALEWRDLEPRAAAAADTIASQVRDRFGVTAEAQAGDAARPSRDSGEAAVAAARAEQRDAALEDSGRSGMPAERYDSPERRERTAAGMRAAGLPPDLVAAAMRADVAYAQPINAIRRSPIVNQHDAPQAPERVPRQADWER